jgi:hypothetical protein
MAHFRAFVEGSRQTRASRCGTKGSGIVARLQTWGWDVEVSASHNRDTEEDTARIWLVEHSSGERKHIAGVNLTKGSLTE